MAEKELLQTVTAKMAGQEMQDKEKVISATVELMREMPLERVQCLYITAYTRVSPHGIICDCLTVKDIFGDK